MRSDGSVSSRTFNLSGCPGQIGSGRGFSRSDRRARIVAGSLAQRGLRMMALTPNTWRTIGYVRDIVVILGIALSALYLSWHPEKFDAFMYWLIGYRYRH